jgi:hypothetical protein
MCIYFTLHTLCRNMLSSPLQPAGLGLMKQRKKNKDAMFQKATYYNSFLIEAIFELLAEKCILTGEEVVERVRKLKDEGGPNQAWVN